MKFRPRYLLAIPLFVVAALFVEVVRYDTSQICAYCDARQSSVGVRAFVLGWQHESSTESDFSLSQFQKDYPEFSCDHSWYTGELRSKIGWDSPIIVSNWSDSRRMSPTRSVMLSYYSERPDFRVSLNERVESGELSRQRIIQMAGLHCMCGGRHFDPEVPEDRVLSALILLEDSH